MITVDSNRLRTQYRNVNKVNQNANIIHKTKI